MFLMYGAISGAVESFLSFLLVFSLKKGSFYTLSTPRVPMMLDVGEVSEVAEGACK